MNKYTVTYSFLGKVHSADIIAESKSDILNNLRTFEILEIVQKSKEYEHSETELSLLME